MEHYSALKRLKSCHLRQHGWALSVMLNGIIRLRRQIPYDSIRMSNLKNKWTNKTYRYREQIGGCQKGGWLRGGQNGWRGLRGINFQTKNK